MAKKSHAASLGVAVAAMLSVAALPAHGEEAPKAPEAAGKRLVYVPHKGGYPVNFFFVSNERAEFARVEVEPDSRAQRVLPMSKSGHPFLPRD